MRSLQRSAVRAIRKFAGRLREFSANQVELQERQLLLYHPWEEEFLHWAPGGVLHGTRIPPRDRRRRSTTRRGWCPGQRDGHGSG